MNKPTKVYILNFPNGKKYVGITKVKMSDRLKAHKHGKQFVSNAVRKYNQEYTYKIVEEFENREDAENLEIELISELKTQNKRFGYNIHQGGGKGGVVKKQIPEDLLLRLYNGIDGVGWSPAQIGEFFNCHAETVRCRLKALGIVFKTSQEQTIRDDILDKDIIKMYEDGITMREIALQYSCSETVIYNRIKKLGLETDYKFRDDIDMDDVIKRREKNEPYKSIAKDYKCSHQTLANKMKKLGLKTNRVYDLDMEDIIARRKKNESYKSIAKDYKCSRHTLAKKMKELGLETGIDMNNVVKRREKNESYASIAKDYKCTRQALSNKIKRFNAQKTNPPKD